MGVKPPEKIELTRHEFEHTKALVSGKTKGDVQDGSLARKLGKPKKKPGARPSAS